MLIFEFERLANGKELCAQIWSWNAKEN